MIFVKFEKDIEESCDNPLKDKDKNNNRPIKPIGAWITQNIGFISDSSAVEEIEDLHEDKSREDESEMSRLNLVLFVVSDVVISPRHCIVHSIGYSTLWLTHVIFGLKVAAYKLVVLISVFRNYVLAKEHQK